ncbi:hypothetical protein [Myxococcus sp. RHSTA-1-4]|uniref:hypothetical protein n=1 Tax=Myxococcus sp. RHSTA-1-4 TaxID=2874601 RepID=UPI001CC0DAD7|nr:hypothetical protein [Myxococcus sp. RHSTA-1-4]MBZ4417990.1 hypothetical protein [Myxococcus sp. RHSTA-1-4]
MVENTPIPPAAVESPSEWFHAKLPSDVGMKPEGFVLKRSILVGSILTMVITSLVTFWLPLFNGLLGGTFGGYHAGRMKRALGAAVVTSIAVPAIIFLMTIITRNNSSYLFYGLGFWGWTVLHVIGTFIGAVAGAVSRPLFTGEFPYSVPAAVSASRAPVPGGVPPARPSVMTETVTREEAEVRASPPTGPVREV